MSGEREQAALRAIVRRHMVACASEAAADANSLPGSSPGGRVMAALVVMARSSAWSLGSTLSANGAGPGEAERVLRGVLAEFEQEFLRGYSDPSEGEIIVAPGVQTPPRRADCPAPGSSGYSRHAEAKEPLLRPLREDNRASRPREDMPRVHPEAHRGDEPRTTASPERDVEAGG